MSKITLEPNASGAGTFTLAAPNSNTNRTLTLPDEAGKVLSTGNNDPAEIFKQSNILGTVSESGGVPTGAIIERDSNANGEYVKYADGTMISWIHNHNGGETSNNSSGNVFRTEDQSYTFPVEFSEFPTVNITSRGFRTWAGNCAGVTTNRISRYRQFSSTTNSGSVEVRIIAIGRWY